MTSNTATAPAAAEFARAAELRACGNAWELVAADLDRDPADVRGWPTQFPALWRKAHSAARRGLLRDSLADAVLTLRRQLRGGAGEGDGAI